MSGKDCGAAFARPLRTIFDVGAVAGLTDGELLERFAGRRGESAELAFAALLERHGPMVLRVCRKVLGDGHDALDAFQATFLVLVRRAHSVRKADSIASWLHGVAYRVAMCDRAAEARRRKHERLAAEGTGRGGGRDHPDDLGPLLHRELDRLPERYRAPLVLCHLQGLTHEQAADRLGWPVGTVKSRMARGRERLKARLTGRGDELSANFAVTGISIPSPTVMDATARAATRLAAGQPIAGTVPASAVALMQGVLNAMTLKKIKLTMAGLLAAGIVATAAGVLAQADQPSTAAAPRHADEPGVSYEARFIEITGLAWRSELHSRLKLVARSGGYTVWSADDETLREVVKRGKGIQSPKVTAFPGAKATITSETRRAIVAGYKGSHFTGHPASEGGYFDPGKLDLGAVVTNVTAFADAPGALKGVIKADPLTVPARHESNAVLPAALSESEVKKNPRLPETDTQVIPEGIQLQLRGEPAEGGVRVRAELELSRIISLSSNPVPEKVALEGGLVDRSLFVQVPEMIQSHYQGEWLVPADSNLIIGLGIHRFPSERGTPEIREQLVAIKVAEVTIPKAGRPNPNLPAPTAR